MKRYLFIAGIIFVCILVMLGGYFVFQKTVNKEDNPQTNISGNLPLNGIANVIPPASNVNNEQKNVPSPKPAPEPSPKPEPVPAPTPPVDFTEIVQGDPSKKQVIFTFDGGSGTQSAQRILDTLASHGVTTTFFLTGKFAENNPELTKKISEQGHEIFNHTYSHPDLTKSSDASIATEFQRTETIIKNLTGKSTKPYFRPPYGARNEHIKDVAKQEGYRSVFWTVDALDWKESEGYTALQSKNRIVSNVRPGTIYLMHIGDNITGEILNDVIVELKSRGYSIVPLSQGI